MRRIIELNKNKTSLSERVSSRKRFGLPTNYEPQYEGIPFWFIQKIGLKYADEKDVVDSGNYLDKWKFIVPKSPLLLGKQILQNL